MTWYSILLILGILLIGVVVYYYFNNKKEGFQTNDNTEKMINTNAQVPPNTIQASVNFLETQGFDFYKSDASGFPVGSFDNYTKDAICANIQQQLDEYNSELQRHRAEGNWAHTHAIRSYINIVKQRQLASSCPTN